MLTDTVVSTPIPCVKIATRGRHFSEFEQRHYDTKTLSIKKISSFIRGLKKALSIMSSFYESDLLDHLSRSTD